ncbi:hypothetical protein C7M84_003032 [Penaeus vannamei]|uniref:Uncharacterized protein n=1 Tax=Penaeus vannamei TaxID=6689 RepID=A0A423TP46_PENVA|nr:hypothetical protein C7M84_003032 [Penaeus vannamei]
MNRTTRHTGLPGGRRKHRAPCTAASDTAGDGGTGVSPRHFGLSLSRAERKAPRTTSKRATSTPLHVVAWSGAGVASGGNAPRPTTCQGQAGTVPTIVGAARPPLVPWARGQHLSPKPPTPPYPPSSHSYSSPQPTAAPCRPSLVALCTSARTLTNARGSTQDILVCAGGPENHYYLHRHPSTGMTQAYTAGQNLVPAHDKGASRPCYSRSLPLNHPLRCDKRFLAPSSRPSRHERGLGIRAINHFRSNQPPLTLQREAVPTPHTRWPREDGGRRNDVKDRVNGVSFVTRPRMRRRVLLVSYRCRLITVLVAVIVGIIVLPIAISSIALPTTIVVVIILIIIIIIVVANVSSAIPVTTVLFVVVAITIAITIAALPTSRLPCSWQKEAPQARQRRRQGCPSFATHFSSFGC